MRSTFTQSITDYENRTVDKRDLSKRPIASTWDAVWNKTNLQQPPPLLIGNSDQPAAYSFPGPYVSSWIYRVVRSRYLNHLHPTHLSRLQMHPWTEGVKEDTGNGPVFHIFPSKRLLPLPLCCGHCEVPQAQNIPNARRSLQ